MKKLTVIGLLLILFVAASHSQNVYTQENLDQASQADLNLYLKNAKSQKTGGIVFLIVGPVIVSSIFVLAAADSNISLDAAGAIFLVGTAITLIGIPVLIVGSKRVKKVEDTIAKRFSLEVAPCSINNYQANSQQYGVSVKFRF